MLLIAWQLLVANVEQKSKILFAFKGGLDVVNAMFQVLWVLWTMTRSCSSSLTSNFTDDYQS